MKGLESPMLISFLSGGEILDSRLRFGSLPRRTRRLLPKKQIHPHSYKIFLTRQLPCLALQTGKIGQQHLEKTINYITALRKGYFIETKVSKCDTNILLNDN